ncbi:hypothetical protein M3Y95_00294700 [Aphelenchoides besseyi]|nr:hypothetical protein M3Y95_00294700 [Aphelenchoides besseyi]
MSLGGLRSIYDEIKTFGARKSMERNGHQSSPNLAARPQATNIKRTQSRDRSATHFWREPQCCCQQRVNESERIRRRIAVENADLRRLCLYLDHQRQQAIDELNRLKQSRTANCWYAEEPCSSSNCEFRNCCPMDPTAAQNQNSESPQQNDEILGYIRALEDRIAMLENRRESPMTETSEPWIEQKKTNFVKLRRPVRSVSQQPSPISTPTPDFNVQPREQMHEIDSSGTLTDSGTTYGSSVLDDEDIDQEEDEDSTATTVYTGANLEPKTTRETLIDYNEKSRTALVRKFLSTRERFLQSIKKRAELPPQIPQHNSNGYAVIQRPLARIGEATKNQMNWSDSDDLPPKLTIVPRIFTNGLSQEPRLLTRRAA